ncbi:hypothetical protein P3T76_012255 [Phytophthora citrophthora]|uniref:Uncharacterized protein n=1 Tax=Phytophthora citrophthora TaxID=4793 RepID=A0AAD9G5L5_9STRA|nr:hypothetical protein P3T76_012255 [Phytophthora citrophthora]
MQQASWAGAEVCRESDVLSGRRAGDRCMEVSGAQLVTANYDPSVVKRVFDMEFSSSKRS